MKILLALSFLASAAMISESDQWKMFGGLLAGCSIGGMGGMLFVAIRATRKPWEVYALRFSANLLFGLGLGALALWWLIDYEEVVPGPLLTVGVGFVFSCFGVLAAEAAVPGLERRLRRIADTRDSDRANAPTERLDKPPPS